MPKLSRPAIKRLGGCIGGGLLTAALGWALLYNDFGQHLDHLSYDLPFLFRTRMSHPNIVMVYIDAASRAKFVVPSTGLIDRRRHVELLQRLTREGARMVFYDIVFRDEVPEVDPAFAAAIREHGKVVLGYYRSGSSHQTEGTSARGFIHQTIFPNRTLREATEYHGLLMLALDSNLAVRSLFTGDNDDVAAVWVAARALDTNTWLAPERRLDERWLNFYGITPAFPSVSFASALGTNDLPPNFFRGKIVVVGSHPDDLRNDKEREKLATPWTDFTRVYSPAVEFLATSLGNLTQGNWLRRVPTQLQYLVIITLGLLFGIGLALLRPWTATAAALGGVAVIVASAGYLHYQKNLWWAWMIPVGAQAPVALVWSIGYQYAVTSRRQRQMRKAFSIYLSPHLVKRMAATDFQLSLGGKEVQATILFTDLEGFTNMAESLPPAEVSKILTSYFERITRHILEEEGTIIKYIGDAVMAVWGAPLPDPRQAERAVLAARGIAQASQESFGGRRLRTRIGINSGKALAGNLGSSFRFDYTVIGATTNLAARLEALNKPLGTDILISGATREQLPPTIPSRYVGRFILRGTSQPTAIYEIPLVLPPTHAIFDQALRACESGDIAAARTLFAQIAKQDRVAAFYLDYLTTLHSPSKPFAVEVS